MWKWNVFRSSRAAGLMVVIVMTAVSAARLAYSDSCSGCTITNGGSTGGSTSCVEVVSQTCSTSSGACTENVDPPCLGFPVCGLTFAIHARVKAGCDSSKLCLKKWYTQGTGNPVLVRTDCSGEINTSGTDAVNCGDKYEYVLEYDGTEVYRCEAACSQCLGT